MSLPKWPVIGVDESGKGDFFGPLVIAGVLVSEKQLPELTSWGVRDSKTIADGKILTLSEKIKKLCRHSLVVINPEKYNQLYGRIRNLNKLLGWGHARAIENILKEEKAEAAISDKFGSDHFIKGSLQEEGKKIELIQMVRGEAHPAVAAASVLARAEFLRRMEALSRQYGQVLPRGASTAVDDVGRSMVKNKGSEILEKVAKLHFKNYKRILF